MSQAVCFSCEDELPLGRSMEELIGDRFPVFCSTICSSRFPDNGTEEFDERLKELSQSYLNKGGVNNGI